MKSVRGGGRILAASERPVAGLFCRPHMVLLVTEPRAERDVPLSPTDAWFIPAT